MMVSEGLTALAETKRSIYDIQIVEIMGLTVDVENTGRRIVSHAAGSVLMTDAFEWNTLFEVGMQRQRSACVSRPFEDVDPTILQAIERLDFVGCVTQLNSLWRSIRHKFNFIRVTGVSRRVRAPDTWLQVFAPER